MRAMILAAGIGERLRPLTAGRAKPAIPLLNRPLISRTLDYLFRYGVREAVINLHHHPGSIREAVERGRPPGLRVEFSEEAVILGTAGGLKKAVSWFRGGGTFTLINSDFVIDLDLEAALRDHRQTGAVATLVLVPADPLQGYGIVEMKGDGLIHRIAGRPPARAALDGPGYTFTGVHLLEPEILERIPPDRPCCINNDIYPPLIEAGARIRGFVHPGRWLEFGTPELFLDGSLALLRAGANWPITPPGGDRPDQSAGEPPPPGAEKPFLIGPECSFGPGAVLLDGVVLGSGVVVGAGSRLRRTIVHDGARIGDGAVLHDCIVDAGTVVPDGSRLSRAMIVPWVDDQGGNRPLRRLGDCGIAGF
jgi:NDP-sugar pyrophosphorylase family protein